MTNTAKQEAIRKAYGDLYELMKENINHTTGSYLVESTHFYDKDNLYKRELFDVKEYSESLLVITPKSLKGIENNNGWIRIESEDDLPKETIDCFFFDKSENAVVCGKYNADFKKFNFSAFIIEWDEHITHYQPIIKPEKPIY